MKAIALRKNSIRPCQTEVSSSKEPITTLERPKNTFRLCTNAADEAIGSSFSEREFPIPCGLVYDAAREPPDSKDVLVQLAAVTLVRVDALASFRTDFIQYSDEFLRIGPIGRRGMPAEHETIPTVRGGVDLVAVIRSVAFA